MNKLAYTMTHQTKSIVAASFAAVLAVGGVGLPVVANAMSTNQPIDHSADAMQRYKTTIRELNNTGVRGTATFTTSGNELTVAVKASGLQPGVHPMHIHGKDVAKAECPTSAQDTNGDGYLSVVEGAPAYGLIKLNATNPQTAFGKPPTPALFYPFAGTPDNANFPVVTANGLLHFKQTFMFDSSADAQAALKSLTPLGNQALVIHGAAAPKSVDAPALAALGKAYAPGTDLTAITYDALLPVGCGTIDQATSSPEHPNQMDMNDNSHQSGSEYTMKIDALQGRVTSELTAASAYAKDASAFKSQSANLSSKFTATVKSAESTYKTSLEQGTNRDVARNTLINTFASAKDQELNGLTESRNQLIDQLNRSGNVADRDAFLNGFNAAVTEYTNKLEQIKNQL